MRRARAAKAQVPFLGRNSGVGISGLVVEYIVAIDVARVRSPADAIFVLEFLEIRSGTGRV